MTNDTLNVTASLLGVPGAQIYYEVQGSGPALPLIPDGPADAGNIGLRVCHKSH